MVPHYYNYEMMKKINGDTQMTDVWRLPAIAPWEKSCGKHPTQKPIGLLSRIILASTEPGAWILDPFAGSSTTGIAANLLGRRFLGIEREEEFAAMAKARREEIEDIRTFAKYKRKISDIVKAEDTQMCMPIRESQGFFDLPFLADDTNTSNNDVLMYSANKSTRKKTESVGKLAIGIKGDWSTSLIASIGYIMFHYWKNDEATPYHITRAPRIVKKQDIPDGYLLRVDANANQFLLIEYDASQPADIGPYDIMKVQRKGKVRYLPFVTTIESITENE